MLLIKFYIHLSIYIMDEKIYQSQKDYTKIKIYINNVLA